MEVPLASPPLACGYQGRMSLAELEGASPGLRNVLRLARHVLVPRRPHTHKAAQPREPHWYRGPVSMRGGTALPPRGNSAPRVVFYVPKADTGVRRGCTIKGYIYTRKSVEIAISLQAA
ncbi:hypothetical protein NDU88_002563 [Pleurodeles waltl]|uniref:Uncharacterized protein n=1 Tax=Pleurodeles waltl TaxID=8319 RepID=A0AAV7W2I2_PLEWA|nr:hypothetical protein NDU88_002563 [Pleurodeles waltl]